MTTNTVVRYIGSDGKVLGTLKTVVKRPKQSHPYVTMTTITVVRYIGSDGKVLRDRNQATTTEDCLGLIKELNTYILAHDVQGRLYATMTTTTVVPCIGSDGQTSRLTAVPFGGEEQTDETEFELRIIKCERTG